MGSKKNMTTQVHLCISSCRCTSVQNHQNLGFSKKVVVDDDEFSEIVLVHSLINFICSSCDSELSENLIKCDHLKLNRSVKTAFRSQKKGCLNGLVVTKHLCNQLVLLNPTLTIPHTTMFTYRS